MPPQLSVQSLEYGYGKGDCGEIADDLLALRPSVDGGNCEPIDGIRCLRCAYTSALSRVLPPPGISVFGEACIDLFCALVLCFVVLEAANMRTCYGRGKPLRAAIYAACLSAFLFFGYDQGVFSGLLQNQDWLDQFGRPVYDS